MMLRNGLYGLRKSCGLILLMVAAALPGCGGGGGGGGGGLAGDTPPVAASASPVNGQGAPTGVNATNAASALFLVSFGPDSTSEDVHVLTFGTIELPVTTTVMGTDGAGSAMAGPVDLTALPDGTHPIFDQATNSFGTSGVVQLGSFEKDTIAYVSPVPAEVTADPIGPTPNGTSLPNVINLVNVQSTTVTLEWGQDADASLTYTVILTDGVGGMVASPTLVAPEGPASVPVTGLDASALQDGPVTLVVRVIDGAGNESVFPGTTAIKDTVVPMVVDLGLPAGDGNAVDAISERTASSLTVQVDLGPGFAPTDVVQLSVSDGTNSVDVGPLAPSATTPWMITGLDARALAEGPVAVSVTVMDENGNQAITVGRPAVKDTRIGSPSRMTILGGAGNTEGWVSAANANAVGFQIGVSGDVSAGDQISLVIQDSVGNSSAPMMATLAGPGVVVMGGLDLSGLQDGALFATLVVSDSAGNQRASDLVPGTKDTQVPVAPTYVRVPATTNSDQDVVNFFNQSSTEVRVETPALAEPNRRLRVRLSDGTHEVLRDFGASSGSAVLSFNADLAGFFEGTFTGEAYCLDAAGNQSGTTSVSILKDTIAPAAPITAVIEPGSSNVQGWVNQSSVTSTFVRVTFPTPYEAANCVVTVSDPGGNGVDAALFVTSGSGGDAVVGPINLSGISDGSLVIKVALEDTARNPASYTSGSGAKDTVAPSAASGMRVSAGTGNAQDVINTQNVNGVSIDITFPSALEGTESYVFTLDDGVSPRPFSGTAAASSSLPLVVNASGLGEGPIDLSLVVTDAAGNSSMSTGIQAWKDTVYPVAPYSVTVARGASNEPNVINASNVSSGVIEAVFDASLVPTDTITLILEAPASSWSFAVTGVTGPIAFVQSGIDTSALPDGNVRLSVRMEDEWGNQLDFAGATVVKDTVVPTLPSTAYIVAGAGNPRDVITAASDQTVSVQVYFPPGEGGSALGVTLRDAATGSVSQVRQGAYSAGSTQLFTGINAAPLQDGAIDVEVTVVDEAGNQDTAVFSRSTKDTTAPGDPTAIRIDMGPSNPEGYVNLATEASVSVTVDLAVPAEGGEVYSLILNGDSGAGRSLPTTTTLAAGAMTASFTGIDATQISDGLIFLNLTMDDALGNRSIAGSRAFKDTVGPASPMVDAVRTPSNSLDATITGVADPESTVELIVAGVPSASATPESSGNFTVSWTAPFGTVTSFTMRTTDAAGNPCTVDQDRDVNNVLLQYDHNPAAPDIAWADITLAAGLGDLGTARGGGFADVDMDGDLDLFVGGTGKLWLNDGSGVFSDVTGTALATFAGSDTAAIFADYDGDGDPDLFVTDNANTQVRVLNNDFVPSGMVTFSDTTVATGLTSTGDVRGILTLDADRDGFLDVAVFRRDVAGNELYIADGMNAFMVAIASGMEGNLGSIQWGAVGDLDQNGFLDIIAGDLTPGHQYMNNLGAFMDNAGALNSGFVTDTSVSNGGMAIADIDNDGDEDIFVASGGALLANQLWLNDGAGNFTDVSTAAGIDAADSAYDVVIADFDNDGLQDIYLACTGANVLYRNLGDVLGMDGVPDFTNVAAQTGGIVNDAASGTACFAADVNGDGCLEVLVGNDAAPNVLYRNDTPRDERFLFVDLQGKGGAVGGSPVQPVGATVSITDSATGLFVARRWVGGGRGAGASDPMTLHFGGLIPSRAYDLEVTWTTGVTTTVTNVVPGMLVGQRQLIVEP